MAAESVVLVAATSVINRAVPALMKKLETKFQQKAVEFQARFLKNFQGHLVKGLTRATNVKTIVSKDKPVKLESIYVPLTVSNDEFQNLPDSTLDPTLSNGRRIVISGTGGAGKTILMKHLLNVASNNQNSIIPLFFELRSVTLGTFDRLESSLYFELLREGAEESEDLFIACLEIGALAIFLDGFDEIHPDQMADTLRAIEIFGRKFPDVSIIASTRPGTGLNELTDFEIYHVDPLNKNQAVDVVKKTKFDKESKSNFVSALENGLYEKHQTMMSIPILVVMMLLTFRSYGDIPDRMTVFYGQAFDTLFSIHDNENKTQYKRIYQSGLAPDQFKQVLESLCFRSLAKHELEFTQDTLERYISQSIQYENVASSTNSFQQDLVKNVCILQPDGITFVFVHRSFQEYFAARFALRYSGSKQLEVMNRVILNRGGGVARMLDEMNRPKFFREWLLPTLLRFRAEFEDLLDQPDWIQMHAFFSQIEFFKGKFHSATAGPRYHFFSDMEVANSVTAGSIGLGSMLPSLRLDAPTQRDELMSHAFWSNYIQDAESTMLDNDGEPVSPEEIIIAIPITEQNSRAIGHLNVKEVIVDLLGRVGVQVKIVQAYVDDQAKLEEDLLA